MAENCSVLDPWSYRPASAWISEASARENAALTRALQMSLSDTTSSSSASADTLSSPLLFGHQLTPPSSSSTSSSSSAAAYPVDVLLRRGNALGPAPAGRVAKRKPRSSKRSSTTYITADPANFREMVQRVTGVSFAGALGEPVGKLEPVRPAVGARAALQQLILPTLDTSACLLDRSGAVGIASESDPFVPSPADEPLAFDFDSLFSAFPTLDRGA